MTPSKQQAIHTAVENLLDTCSTYHLGLSSTCLGYALAHLIKQAGERDIDTIDASLSLAEKGALINA